MREKVITVVAILVILVVGGIVYMDYSENQRMVAAEEEAQLLVLEKEAYEEHLERVVQESANDVRLASINGYEKLANGDPITVYIIGYYGIDDQGMVVSADPLWLNDFKLHIKETYGSDVVTQVFPVNYSSVVLAWMLNEQIGHEDYYNGFDFLIFSSGTFDSQMINQVHFGRFYEAVIRDIYEKNDDIIVYGVTEPFTISTPDYFDTVLEVADYYRYPVIDSRNNDGSVDDNAYIAEGLADLIDTTIDEGNVVLIDDIDLVEPFDSEVLELENPVIAVEPKLADGFRRLDENTSNTIKNVNSSGYIAYDIDTKYAILTFAQFDGGGKIDIYINDEFITEIDTHLEGNRGNRTIVLADDLVGTNRIEVRLKGDNTPGDIQIFNLSTN